MSRGDNEGDETGSAHADEPATTGAGGGAAVRSGADDRFCADCGSAIDVDAEVCPACGVRQQTASAGASGGGDSSESVAAALLSFLVPGAGNFLNGQAERGTIILVLWIAWLVLGWGIGLVFVGSLLTLITLGFGALLLPFVGLALLVVEFLIHVLAAVDAYQQSELVDRVTVRAREVRRD